MEFQSLINSRELVLYGRVQVKGQSDLERVTTPTCSVMKSVFISLCQSAVQTGRQKSESTEGRRREDRKK